MIPFSSLSDILVHILSLKNNLKPLNSPKLNEMTKVEIDFTLDDILRIINNSLQIHRGLIDFELFAKIMRISIVAVRKF